MKTNENHFFQNCQLPFGPCAYNHESDRLNNAIEKLNCYWNVDVCPDKLALIRPLTNSLL